MLLHLDCILDNIWVDIEIASLSLGVELQAVLGKDALKVLGLITWCVLLLLLI